MTSVSSCCLLMSLILADPSTTPARARRELSLADCREIIGNEIDRPVTWKSAEISTLAGRDVRLRFAIVDADLYAIEF